MKGVLCLKQSQREKALALIAKKQGKVMPSNDSATPSRYEQKKPTNSLATTKATKKYMKKSPH